MGRPRSNESRTKKLATPATTTEIADYLAACKKSEVEPADTMRKLIAAFVRHVREHGSFTFPVRFSTREREDSDDE